MFSALAVYAIPRLQGRARQAARLRIDTLQYIALSGSVNLAKGADALALAVWTATGDLLLPRLLGHSCGSIGRSESSD